MLVTEQFGAAGATGLPLFCSRVILQASSSLRLGLLATLLGCQHLLWCLPLSVEQFLHVPILIQVHHAIYWTTK